MHALQFFVVVYQVKDTIFWKQITTTDIDVAMAFELFIKSKIQFFESKSQLICYSIFQHFCCLSSQRYNFLKANHNSFTTVQTVPSVVYQVKDTIFWKQITTIIEDYVKQGELFIKSKIQFFESKSQPFHFINGTLHCCLSSQRYNFLKANHNVVNAFCIELFVVYQVKDTIFWKQITTLPSSCTLATQLFIKSKIQFFESKSQLENYSNKIKCCCLSSQRYNFLKANHNSEQRYPNLYWLFIKSKIQFFESKSQPGECSTTLYRRCLSSQRYNFLKANHNIHC